jgi:hypothetical protein
MCLTIPPPMYLSLLPPFRYLATPSPMFLATLPPVQKAIFCARSLPKAILRPSLKAHNYMPIILLLGLRTVLASLGIPACGVPTCRANVLQMHVNEMLSGQTQLYSS